MPPTPPTPDQPDQPVTAYIGIGSNLGDRIANLRAAINAIQPLAVSISTSSVYESEPFDVGDEQHPMYLNMAISITTNLTPEQLLSHLMRIEQANGRLRIRKNEPRTLDLDILTYGDQIIDSPTLTIPHPRMHQRAFVMLPLAEIAPHALHPVSRRTMSDIADNLPRQTICRIGPLNNLPLLTPATNPDRAPE